MVNEQISEITTVPTNATVIKIINTLIKRYNSLGSIYTFKGSVQTYAELLAIENPNVGDVYNVVQEDEEHQIAAGSNFVWDGTVWDNLGGSLAGLVQSVNGINPDSLGNVLLPLIKNITTNQGVLTITKNDNSTEQFNNIKKLYMLTLGENVDLNNIKESGIYICANNVYAANYENCPIQKAFLLEVQSTVSDQFTFQFLTQYNDGSTEAGNQYIRTYYNNSWSAWRMAGSGSNLTTYTSLEQIGITPGQETFASIHSALPINSVLEMALTPSSPLISNTEHQYGHFRAFKSSETTHVTFFTFHETFYEETNNLGNLFITYYNEQTGNIPVWTQLAKQSDLTDLSNNINRKSYNSLASLGLSYQTVTFADIINALPVNSTLTFYVDVVTSQPTYAPNLQIPASGLVIVVKGAADWVPTLFYLNPIVKGYTSYIGQYTTYNDYGFSGWKPMVLSVNAIKPNINGNVDITGVPTGTILPFAGGTIPSGFLACNGAAVSRTTYAALYSAIGTTYGAGDGSTTFNLPNTVARFLEGGVGAGTYYEAGLPNITGQYYAVVGGGITVNGAFTGSWADSSGQTSGGGGYNRVHLVVDASKSNSIYGNSETVQPPAITVIYCIKY